MEKSRNTFAAAHAGTTPQWFVFLARLLPVGIFAQFLSAGFGLFLDPDLLGVHAGLGIALSLPAIGLAAGALLVPGLHAMRPWAGLVLLLYLVQVGLAAGAAPVPLALHPANGALLLGASLFLLARVERRRAHAAGAS